MKHTILRGPSGEVNVNQWLEHLFSSSGHQVRLFASAEELLAQDVVADCFLFDVRLPILSGIDLAERIRANGSDVAIVLMTGHDEESTRTAIVRAGLSLLRKPFDEREILSAVMRGRVVPA